MLVTAARMGAGGGPLAKNSRSRSRGLADSCHSSREAASRPRRPEVWSPLLPCPLHPSTGALWTHLQVAVSPRF